MNRDLDRNGLKESFRNLLSAWSRLWRMPGLAQEISVEFSSRMTRSLGLAYPRRNLIRLNVQHLSGDRPRILEQVLCHEAAHIAVFWNHGRAARPHGKEWRELVRMAGYDPAKTLAVESLDSRAFRANGTRRGLIYLHTCSHCGAVRTARKAMKDWRCVDCFESGFDGKLRITTRPAGREAGP